ncbi:putative arsenical pump-driving atpase [Tripterygium wilfordii]|uniref:Putative arsenical pump-driving atpase n=1 Tax=Tripterygium wilfordii TaxID=458696 RepID=A0A7J7CI47_TRIWF|nr:putative arsenical pump-driving atpase [Tripterygium wilfordii]
MAASSACCRFSSRCSPLLATRSKNSIEALGSLSFSPKTHRRIPSLFTGFISPSIKNKRQRCPLRVRSVAAPAKTAAGFDEMVSGMQRKYYLLGGKGGVGKTSCAASLAVKFPNNGHATLVVSTDPAHSLGDSFAQINPEKARKEFRNASQKNGGTGVKDLMDGMGLGMIVEQLGELKLGELLDTPPPGLDEAIAISKVIQFLESEEYSMFTRIIFDTAPTVSKCFSIMIHSISYYVFELDEMFLTGQKIASATNAIKSVFGQEETRNDAVSVFSFGALFLLHIYLVTDFLMSLSVAQADKLERLRERMIKVRELFHDTDSTEFVIVTIPTVMAISESSRLHASLKKENVPVKRLIVNQILSPSASDCKFCATKRKDQMRSLDMVNSDPELSSLMFVEIRGVPALQFIGDIIWK